MKKVLNSILIVTIGLLICGCRQRQTPAGAVFQVSTIKALLAGVYDGEVTYGELQQKGDFGLGTFNGLDGEMVALAGEFYQIKIDGVAYSVSDDEKTPFAVVTFFNADQKAVVAEAGSLKQLEEIIDSLLPTENIFYAVRIDGFFRYLQVRSVPRQKQPYPVLMEVIKDQAVFEFQDVSGTIVGFRCPAYVSGLNAPGYHFHFISRDRKAGGHLLECQLADAEIALDYLNRFSLVLPVGGEFSQVDLQADREKELTEVEG